MIKRDLNSALLLFALTLSVCSYAATKTNPQIVLTRDGNPVSAIVIAKNAARSAQFAAFELQYHIEKITGAKLPIVTDDANVAGIKILVGDTQATAAMGIHSSDFKPQEYLISFRPNTLILMGRDSDDTRAVDYANENTFPGAFEDQGTCYATYDFLERFCGVRWYLPTETGLVCPNSKTLKITGANIRRSPPIRYRWMTPVVGTADLCGDTMPSAAQPPRLSDRDNALWNRRYRIGGEPYEANHSFYGYYDRFLKTHPDWFAQGYESDPPQMCYTNPGFIAQVVQDARDYFDGKGLQPRAIAQGDYFALVPMDGGPWCKCPTCRELLKDGDSNYFYTFVNKVAREIKKSHPDKWISTIAYSYYSAVPTKVKLESNVTIMVCLNVRTAPYRLVYQADLMKRLSDWVAESRDRPKYLWLYFCFPALQGGSEQFRCFPGFFAHQLVKDMEVFNKSGMRGIFIEPSYLPYGRKSFMLDQLEWYIVWRMADDPSLDGNKLIDEFFTLYYGSAAVPMKKIYNKIEDIYCSPKYYPSGDTNLQTEEIAWKYLGTEDRMKEIGTLMNQAKTAASTDIEKQRVALFDKGIWQYMLAGRKTYLDHEALKSSTMQEVSVPRIANCAGGLAQVDWSKAGVISNWYTNMGQTSPRGIEARIAHDGSYLYLRLEELIDTKMLLVDKSNVWAGDDWEIFLANQRSLPYRQMGVGADGFHLDIAVGESSDKWDSGSKVISDVATGGKWTAMVCIPLNNLVHGGAKAGDTIYANIFRGAAGAQIDKSAAWIPTFGHYAVPTRFGKMILEN